MGEDKTLVSSSSGEGGARKKGGIIRKIFPKKSNKEQNVKFVSEATSNKVLSGGGKEDQSSALMAPDKELEQTGQEEYRSYPQRWWLLVTVLLLNLANYSHWVAFPSVTKVAARYYDQPGEAMDRIPTLSYGLGVPCCVLATYVVERFGLRAGLHVGGSLTGIGGLLCFLSSLPGLADDLTSDEKYYMALIGQALTGVACPFISCVPTKISQHWFSDSERTVATILLGMSNPLGIVMGQGITPLIVHEASDVPLMNIVWFVPAAAGALLTMFKVTANRPPTPPSPSAALVLQEEDGKGGPKSYWPSIRKLVTNKAFLILFVFVGGAMGYVSCISTKIEQIMCARGYSDQLSGLSGSLILLVGFFASFPFGLLAFKTGRLTLICKICGAGAIAALCLLAFFLDRPNVGAGIVASCVMMGIFALGCYPLALELVVECTYPVDQATGTAFIFLSSAVQGVLLMQVENSFGRPLSEEEMLIQTCVEPGDEGHQQPKDYTSYLAFITAYMGFFIMVFVLFFKTELHRTNADSARRSQGANSSSSSDGGSNEKPIHKDVEAAAEIAAASATTALMGTSSDHQDRESNRSEAETAETMALTSSSSSSSSSTSDARSSRASSVVANA